MAQVVLPLVQPSLSPMLLAAAEGRLTGVGLARRSLGEGGSPASGVGVARVAVGVVLAAAGYPGDVRSGDVIHGLDTLARDCPDAQVYFAGVKQEGGALVTSGGRVLTIVATAETFERAIAGAYDAVARVRFEGMQFRTDIGRKALPGSR